MTHMPNRESAAFWTETPMLEVSPELDRALDVKYHESFLFDADFCFQTLQNTGNKTGFFGIPELVEVITKVHKYDNTERVYPVLTKQKNELFEELGVTLRQLVWTLLRNPYIIYAPSFGLQGGRNDFIHVPGIWELVWDEFPAEERLAWTLALRYPGWVAKDVNYAIPVIKEHNITRGELDRRAYMVGNVEPNVLLNSLIHDVDFELITTVFKS